MGLAISKMTHSPDYSGLLYRALLLLLILVVLLGMGTYMHGAWNLVDEAVCGVIVAASWFCSRPKSNGFRNSTAFDRISSLEAWSGWWHETRVHFPCEVVAVVAAVITAAFFEPWSTNEVVVVGGLVILPQILNLPYIIWYRRK